MVACLLRSQELFQCVILGGLTKTLNQHLLQEAAVSLEKLTVAAADRIRPEWQTTRAAGAEQHGHLGRFNHFLRASSHYLASLPDHQTMKHGIYGVHYSAQAFVLVGN